MKLRELLNTAHCVDMRIKDDVSDAEVVGDDFDLLDALKEGWLNAEVQAFEVEENTLNVHLEVR